VRPGFHQNPEQWMRSVLPGVQMLFQVCSGSCCWLSAPASWVRSIRAGTLSVPLARGSGRLRLLAAKIAALLCFGLEILALYALLAAIYFGSVAVAADGSPGAFVALSPRFWQDLGLMAVADVASMVACITVGVPAAVTGRSLAFAVGVAMAFFATGSLYTQWAPLLVNLTHQQVLAGATAYLLGPNLNALSQHLRMEAPATVPGPGPTGGVHTVHAALVTAWMSGMLTLSAVPISSRDVLE
jgi:ABC-2 type transport system permease protein